MAKPGSLNELSDVIDEATTAWLERVHDAAVDGVDGGHCVVPGALGKRSSAGAPLACPLEDGEIVLCFFWDVRRVNSLATNEDKIGRAHV